MVKHETNITYFMITSTREVGSSAAAAVCQSQPHVSHVMPRRLLPPHPHRSTPHGAGCWGAPQCCGRGRGHGHCPLPALQHWYLRGLPLLPQMLPAVQSLHVRQHLQWRHAWPLMEAPNPHQQVPARRVD